MKKLSNKRHKVRNFSSENLLESSISSTGYQNLESPDVQSSVTYGSPSLESIGSPGGFTISQEDGASISAMSGMDMAPSLKRGGVTASRSGISTSGRSRQMAVFPTGVSNDRLLNGQFDAQQSLQHAIKVYKIHSFNNDMHILSIFFTCLLTYICNRRLSP